jgi:hypothetical protein
VAGAPSPTAWRNAGRYMGRTSERCAAGVMGEGIARCGENKKAWQRPTLPPTRGSTIGAAGLNDNSRTKYEGVAVRPVHGPSAARHADSLGRCDAVTAIRYTPARE